MYFGGWDGGGTKTAVCLTDEAGREIAQASFGPLNPNGSTRETVEATVRNAVAWMSAQPGGLQACAGVVVGISGVSNQASVQMISQAARGSGYQGPLCLLGDQEIALAGAVRGPGAVLIAGTGSICFGRDEQGELFRTGGWGQLIDDEGSGYALGRDMLTAVVRAADGRGEATCLTALVMDRLGVRDPGGIITWLYAPETNKKDVAALAPLLLTALEKEDPAARRIAMKAAAELALLVKAAWKKRGMTGGELALTGSILTHHPLIRQELVRLLGEALPGIRISSPWGTAAQGAALLAREKFGVKKEDQP